MNTEEIHPFINIEASRLLAGSVISVDARGRIYRVRVPAPATLSTNMLRFAVDDGSHQFIGLRVAKDLIRPLSGDAHESKPFTDSHFMLTNDFGFSRICSLRNETEVDATGRCVEVRVYLSADRATAAFLPAHAGG